MGTHALDIEQFIEEKSKQVCFYMRAFWRETIDYAELNYFFWDTLEEWSLCTVSEKSPYSHRERVFWHLLHQIHFWPEHQLRKDRILCEELQQCVEFLQGKSNYPTDCIGLRP